jgi:hypothetical protein
MVFVVPHTWSTQEMVTHDELNAELRDQLLELQLRVLAIENSAASVKAAQDDMLTGWIPYTPVITATGTNPTLGAASTATGSYKKVGKTVIGRIDLMFGSSGINKGSGFYYFSLPLTPVQNSGVIGAGYIWDNAAKNLWTTTVRLYGTKAEMIHTSGLSRYRSSESIPMVWIGGDGMGANFTYEIL